MLATLRGTRARGFGLSVQQLRVLRLVARGATNREIGAQLGIAPETVKTHVRDAMQILGAYDRQHAAQLLAESMGAAGIDSFALAKLDLPPR